MTRKDFTTLQAGFGDALYRIRHNKRLTQANNEPEIVFWYIVETMIDYLKENNKNFDDKFFKDEILRIAEIGDQTLNPTHEDFLRDCLGLKIN